MILYEPAGASLARAFAGPQVHMIQLPGQAKARPIMLDPQLRAMVAAMAWELSFKYELDFVISSVFRSWEAQDRLYKDQAIQLGKGPKRGKKISPHMVGRAVDGYVVGEGAGGSLIEEAMVWVEKYLDETFPYGWNNPRRKVHAHSSAWRHVHLVDGKSQGDHVHIQISW
jgi:hypothetical protein